MKTNKFRLVLECVILATEIVRLAIALLNMAFNYSSFRQLEHEVVEQV